jgi:hypothetical protein
MTWVMRQARHAQRKFKQVLARAPEEVTARIELLRTVPAQVFGAGAAAVLTIAQQCSRRAWDRILLRQYDGTLRHVTTHTEPNAGHFVLEARCDLL